MEGAPCVCDWNLQNGMNVMNDKPSEAYWNIDFIGCNVILNAVHASFYAMGNGNGIRISPKRGFESGRAPRRFKDLAQRKRNRRCQKDWAVVWRIGGRWNFRAPCVCRLKLYELLVCVEYWESSPCLCCRQEDIEYKGNRWWNTFQIRRKLILNFNWSVL